MRERGKRGKKREKEEDREREREKEREREIFTYPLHGTDTRTTANDFIGVEIKLREEMFQGQNARQRSLGEIRSAFCLLVKKVQARYHLMKRPRKPEETGYKYLNRMLTPPRKAMNH